MASKLYALLVGIDHYSAVGRMPHLRGCVADVLAMREWLVGRLGIAPGQIQLLLNEQATRAAIIQGWRSHLRDRVALGDFVLFHYSGHGSQAHSSDPAEPDGFAESVVAYDSRDPGSYDLLDKELGALIAEVEQKGAHVALVMDCCHSGHITRTLDETRPLARQCRPDERPRPPETVLSAVQPAATRSATARQAGSTVGSHVLLAACRDDELANEYLPPVTRRWQGVLTFCFLQTVSGAQAPLSWATLHDQVYTGVRSRYPSQSPQLEGPGDRLLFGGLLRPGAAYLRVEQQESADRIKVDGGAAVGLAEGSRLTLHPPGDQPTNRPLGAATVEQVAVDHAWARLDRPQPIPPGSRARITAWGYGDQQAVVVVAEPLVQQAIAVAAAGKPSPFLRLEPSTPTSSPDFFVVTTADGLMIQDAAGEPLLPTRWPATADGAAQLVRTLEHLTIYRNVYRLRNPATDAALRGAIALIDLTPLRQGARTGVVHPGEPISFRLHNQSRQALYVAVLHLDATYAIRRLLPDRGGVEKIAPGAKTLPVRAQAGAASGFSGYGRELFKIFVSAVPATFDALRLPPLGGGDPLSAAVTRDGSPLGWLLNAVRHNGTRPIIPVGDETADQWWVEQLEFLVDRPTRAETR